MLNQINLECDSSIIFTDTISYYDVMGPALYLLCQFDSSLHFFDESLIDNPTDVEILVNKGSTLGKLGYFSESLVFYDQAINIDPNFLPAKNNKANALANFENLTDAISLYDEVLEQNPNYVTAKNNCQFALSLLPQISNVINISTDSIIDDASIQQLDDDILLLGSTIFEKSNFVASTQDNSVDFFEEVGPAFSFLGSVFNFLN